MKVCAIVGVGKGIGGAVAKKFAREGYAVAIMARNQTYKSSPDKLTPLRREILDATPSAKVLPVIMDAADETSVRNAFAQVARDLGPVDTLVYNAGARRFRPTPLCEEDPAEFAALFKINCLGALLCAQQVAPAMVSRASGGAILLTGATASLRGMAGMAHFSSGKAALRMLAQSMARELGPQGVHVAHIIIDGMVDLPILRKLQPGVASDRFIDPRAVADTYFHLANQPPSCWTLELDVRPANEPIFSKL